MESNGPFRVTEDLQYTSKRFHVIGPCYVGVTMFEHEAEDECNRMNRAWHSRDQEIAEKDKWIKYLEAQVKDLKCE